MITKNKFGPKQEISENILPSIFGSIISYPNLKDKSPSSIVEAEEEEKFHNILPLPTFQSPKGII